LEAVRANVFTELTYDVNCGVLFDWWRGKRGALFGRRVTDVGNIIFGVIILLLSCLPTASEHLDRFEYGTEGWAVETYVCG
jgi:hypothetical protein